MTNWFYLDDGKQSVGPVSQDRLISLLGRMSLPTDVLVWQPEFNDWKSVSEVPQLVSSLGDRMLGVETHSLEAASDPGIRSVANQAGAETQTTKEGTRTWTKESVQAFGGFLLAAAIAVGLGTALLLFFYGATWASEHLLGYVFVAAQWVLLFCVLVLGPLSGFRKTRGISAFGFFSSSYVFGTCLWMIGLLTAYFYWGLKAIIIGMGLFGVGVVPVALLASMFNTDWMAVSMMLVGLILTYGTRLLAFWMFDHV